MPPFINSFFCFFFTYICVYSRHSLNIFNIKNISFQRVPWSGVGQTRQGDQSPEHRSHDKEIQWGIKFVKSIHFNIDCLSLLDVASRRVSDCDRIEHGGTGQHHWEVVRGGWHLQVKICRSCLTYINKRYDWSFFLDQSHHLFVLIIQCNASSFVR